MKIQAGGRVAVVLAILGAVILIVLTAVYLIPKLEGVGAAASPVSTEPALPEGDLTEHDIWASSTANVWTPIDSDDWVMTSFSVDLPYIRSVEIAAGPNSAPDAGPGDLVLLRILDEHGSEIDQGESEIVNWRAKVVFDHAVDVRPYLGKHLFLQMVNITDMPIRAYLTPDDRDRSVTSYLPCEMPIPTLCPNPVAQDLSARIVGRYHPW